MNFLFLALLPLLIAGGCATPREITLPKDPLDPDQQAITSVKGGRIEVKTKIQGRREIHREKQISQIVQYEQERREEAAWHRQTLKAINEAKLIAPPNAISDGTRPVIFINNRDYPIWIEYWQDDVDISERPRFRVPSANSYDSQNHVVRFLQEGEYFWQVDDYRGRPIMLRMDRGDGQASSQVRASTFKVGPTPNFEYMGNKYFGFVRIFGN